MTFNTPVLTDRVPYTWDELKSHTVDANFHHRIQQKQSDAFGQRPLQSAGLNPLARASVGRSPVTQAVQSSVTKPSVVKATEPALNKVASQQDATVSPKPFVSDNLVGEIVDAVVPLIMERVHAQVSIMVDMTMKQAASKIRNDFDNALKITVQSAVQKVMEEKLKK